MDGTPGSHLLRALEFSFPPRKSQDRAEEAELGKLQFTRRDRAGVALWTAGCGSPLARGDGTVTRLVCGRGGGQAGGGESVLQLVGERVGPDWGPGPYPSSLPGICMAVTEPWPCPG